MNRAQYAAERLHGVLARRGATITLRTPASAQTDTPNPKPNPPRHGALVVDGAHVAGATTLKVRGDTLAGRFVAGDTLVLGGVRYVVQAEAAAAGNKAALTVSPALAAAYADGAALTPVWAADQAVPADIRPYPIRLADGSLIKGGDLEVTVSAHRLEREPDENSTVILPDGKQARVVVVLPMLVEGVAAGYRLQVRR